jgi:hypothetical protein
VKDQRITDPGHTPQSFAHWFARRYRGGWLDVGLLENVAMLAEHEARPNFDASRGTLLWSYLYGPRGYVRGALYHEARRQFPLGRVRFEAIYGPGIEFGPTDWLPDDLEAPVPGCDGLTWSEFAADPRPTPEERVTTAAYAKHLVTLMVHLTPLQRQAVEETVIHDRRQADVARELGVSQNAINDRRHKGLRALRELAHAEGML